MLGFVISCLVSLGHVRKGNAKLGQVTPCQENLG